MKHQCCFSITLRDGLGKNFSRKFFIGRFVVKVMRISEFAGNVDPTGHDFECALCAGTGYTDGYKIICYVCGGTGKDYTIFQGDPKSYEEYRQQRKITVARFLAERPKK